MLGNVGPDIFDRARRHPGPFPKAADELAVLGGAGAEGRFRDPRAPAEGFDFNEQRFDG